jgi:hypothetical protein
MGNILIFSGFWHSDLTCSKAATFLEDKISFAPLSAYIFANAAPIPEEAPVIQTVFLFFSI